MKKLLFFNLLLLFFAVFSASAQVTNISATFACPAGVVVSFDLNSANPVDVTLYYSHDSGQTWLVAQSISGDITNQTTGTGKTIVWDNQADNVTLGRFRLRVEIPEPELCCPESVYIAGTCWATRNVGMPGTFVNVPSEHGGFFTWYEAQTACPPGWRLPTQQEFLYLFNTGTMWTSVVNSGVLTSAARVFGTRPEYEMISFPAAGGSFNGNTYGVLSRGLYWTSEQLDSVSAWHLEFNNTNRGSISFNLMAAYSFSVRCVRE